MSGRILVVDDIATNRLILQAKLSAAYFEVLLAEGGEQAIEIAHAELPDMILLDVMMPGIDGYEVCKRLKSAPETAHIPIVMVTAANEQTERIRGFEAGADDFLNKPINDMTLFTRVRNLLRVKIMFDELKSRETTTHELGLTERLDLDGLEKDQDCSVMLAPSSYEQGSEWMACLRERLPYNISVSYGEDGSMEHAKTYLPDAYVINQSLMNEGDGLKIISALGANPETRQAAIILVVEDGKIETAAQGLELGASDYIFAPFDVAEMSARLASQMRRKKYSDLLRSNVQDSLRMAVIDPLTGLYNRRYAVQHMRRIKTHSDETGLPFAVMMMDLDKFKNVNDTYGHAAGDEVLQEFARRLQENLRGVDLVARLGGEEFLIVMPETTETEAGFAAERLRKAIDHRDFKLSTGKTIPITVSIGVAFGQPVDSEPETLIDNADKALYESKSTGRNRVSYFADAA